MFCNICILVDARHGRKSVEILSGASVLFKGVWFGECNLTDEKGFGVGCTLVEKAREKRRREVKRTESRYSVKRVGIRGEESRRRKSFRPGEKPVRLKGRKVEKAEETNKEEKEPRREKELRGTASYTVANEATDARSDNG
ncbi:hypothetical protein K0M31_012975 [Melipona bicolor]|uniref:Uncharacterized protein n=1 Tax=Melipona bicolor TaxID=60889 RepID=A0AA40FJB0_9HYME|nr:hypothetical protein K0M31_012975 [Melipona bicolor]